MIILRVAVLNNAAFEFDAHAPLALKAGFTQTKIDALREHAIGDQFTQEEQLLLELTDRMTRDVKVPEELMDRVSAHRDPGAVVELVATVAAYNMVASDRQPSTYLESPTITHLRLPPLSCDSHVHVFGPLAKFPYAQNRPSTPVEAPKEALFALHKRMGIQRCVIVQSVMHGTDNRVVEDAIAAGEGRYLGVALVKPDVPDAELQRLSLAGFRGVRFNFMRHIENGTTLDE
eukprot:gene55196-73736_t